MEKLTVILFILLQFLGTVEQVNISKFSKKFLTKYGYRRSWLIRIPPEEYRRMLVSYQNFSGLNITGRLTNETIQLMRKPRCGLRDPWKAIKTNPNQEFLLQGTQWKTKKLLHWKITKLPTNKQKQNFTEVFKSAFANWARHGDIKFIEATQPEDEIDIEIRFTSLYHKDPYPFDGKGGSLAHAFYPHKERGFAGDIHIDEDDVMTGETNFEWLATHLIGHSLGIEHHWYKSSIMYPVNTNFKSRNGFQLPDTDRNAIEALYGLPERQTDSTTPRSTTIMSTTQTTPALVTKSTTKTVTTTKKHTRPAENISTLSISKTPHTTSTNLVTTRSTQPPTQFKRRTTVSPPLENCPVAAVTALVYYEFHKRKLIFFNSNTLILVTDNGNKYTTKRTNLIPLFSDKLQSVDAALMATSKSKKYLIIFSGNNYFIYHSRYFQFASGPHNIHGGSGLFNFTLPKYVQRIDGALMYNGNIHIISEDKVWKYDTVNQRIHDDGGKKISEIWKGIPDNLDAAYNHNNEIYFLKDGMMFLLDEAYANVAVGYPKPWGKEILNCN